MGEKNLTKSTFSSERIDLFAPMFKDNSGKYIAILSDDSLDRDGEYVDKVALEDVCKEMDYLAGLIDHENKALNQVCKWINKRVEKIGENYALIAEPHFFLSNPQANIIKGMLDEGARFGISIGAIIKEYVEREVNEVKRVFFTKLELVEASFVAVPANRHSQALALNKKFNSQKKMEKTYSEEEYTKAIEDTKKSFSEEKEKFEKSFNDEISKLKKSLEEKESAFSAVAKEKEELSSKVKSLSEELETEKKKGLEKSKFDEFVVSEEAINKSFSEGMLPVINKE